MTTNMAAVLRVQPPRPCVDEAATFRSLVIPPPPRHLKLKYNRVSNSVKLRRHRSSSIVSELKNQSKTDNPPGDGGEDNGGVKIALSMLRFYKREISPLMPNSCRYVPTCSEYSMEAYKRYGVAKGTVLTAWRLCRCNPFGGSGFDPPRWFDEERPVDD